MKTKMIFLILLIFFVNCNLLNAQNNYAILGDFGYFWILKFEVLDQQTNLPARNVRIEMFENIRKIFSITTDRNGVGVVIVKDTRYIPSFGKIKITAPNYQYWETEFSRSDFKNNEHENELVIPDEKCGQQYLDWTSGNCIPSDSKIVFDISNREYDIWKDKNFYYVGPGLFEYNILLNEVHRDGRYENNPESNTHINNSVDNEPSSEYQGEPEISDRWHEVKPKEEGGNIYKIYVKGNVQLMIAEDVDGRFWVSKGEAGGIISYCIDEFGNQTGFKSYPKLEAMRIVNIYMRNH